MLTTDQILNAMFTPVSRGAYSADEVDAFLKTIAESYEQALQDNKELIKKISILAEKLESYRSDEEAIKLALLDARRLSESINKDANIKAETVVSEAQANAKAILDEAAAQSNQMVDEAREKAKEIVDNARVAVTSLTDRAQNETEQAITAAQQKATEIVLKAEAQGREIIGRSKADFEYYSCELERIKKETESYKLVAEKLCKDQLALIENVKVPEITVAEKAPVIEEIQPVAEEIPEVVTETVPQETEIPAAEEPTTEVQADNIAETEDDILDVLDIPVFEESDPVVQEETPAETDEDDIFSMIEELNFEDIVAPEEIPATLEEAVAEHKAAAESNEGDDDLDDFQGFEIDLEELDKITSDVDLKEDEDITSLFDSFFSE